MTNNQERSAPLQLVYELHHLLDDVQHMFAESGGQTGEALDVLRHKASASITAMKARLQACEQGVIQESVAAVKATDQYVHGHPWQSIGIAVAAGFLVGCLVKRT